MLTTFWVPPTAVELPTMSHCEPEPVTFAAPLMNAAPLVLLVDVTFAPSEMFSALVPAALRVILPVVQVVPVPAMFAVPLLPALVPSETDVLVAVDPPFRLNVPAPRSPIVIAPVLADDPFVTVSVPLAVALKKPRIV